MLNFTHSDDSLLYTCTSTKIDTVEVEFFMSLIFVGKHSVLQVCKFSGYLGCKTIQATVLQVSGGCLSCIVRYLSPLEWLEEDVTTADFKMNDGVWSQLVHVSQTNGDHLLYAQLSILLQLFVQIGGH